MANDFTGSESSTRLKPLLMILKATTTGVILYFLLSQQWGTEALQKLQTLTPVWVVAALLILCFAIVLATVRWRRIIFWLAGIHIKTSQLFGLNGVSMLLGQALPSTVGGDAFRIVALAPTLRTKMSFRTVLADRVVGMVALGLLVVPAGSALAIESHFSFVTALPLAIALSGICCAVLLMAVFSQLDLDHILVRPLRMLGQDLLSVLRGARFIDTMGLSLGIHLLSVLAFLLLAAAIDAKPNTYWILAIVVPPGLLISALPVSLGGWGVREGAIVAAFILLGGDPSVALLLSVTFGVLNIVAAALASFAWIFRADAKRHKVAPLNVRNSSR